MKPNDVHVLDGFLSDGCVRWSIFTCRATSTWPLNFAGVAYAGYVDLTDDC